jgi:hypothetical protein
VPDDVSGGTAKSPIIASAITAAYAQPPARTLIAQFLESKKRILNHIRGGADRIAQRPEP